MAAAASSYPFVLYPLIKPSSSPSINLTVGHQPCHRLPRITNPRTRICHAKPNRVLEDEAEEIEEILEDESDEEEEEEENSFDLLFRFLQNVLGKISKRAKKATRSVLPPMMSPQLVSFAVDGVLLLTSLSIAKALLEVVCSLGGTVFTVILLLRVIWATVSYFQSSGNGFNQGGAYSTTPVA